MNTALVLFQQTALPLPTSYGEALLILFGAGAVGVILRQYKRIETAYDALLAKRDLEREAQLLGLRASVETMNKTTEAVQGVTAGYALLMRTLVEMQASDAARDTVIAQLQRDITGWRKEAGS